MPGLPSCDPAIRLSNLLPATTNLRYFRGDNRYVFQLSDDNAETNYLLTAFYLKSIDALGLFHRLQEDRLFGVNAFDLGDGSLISRDLLDSICEITFLEETIGVSRIPDLRILDIGAGYGRMGYRLPASLPNLNQVLCVDAVPESTFLCEYYLNFRGVTDRATTLALDEIENAICLKQIQLAVNIHSFSECSITAISWWLDLVSKNRIRYLFIVPNRYSDSGNCLYTTEIGQSNNDFLPAILSRGYRLVKKRPKYNLPVLQKYGISPTYYYLFELQGTD
jgi:putative sugar O-methyltransferase